MTYTIETAPIEIEGLDCSPDVSKMKITAYIEDEQAIDDIFPAENECSFVVEAVNDRYHITDDRMIFDDLVHKGDADLSTIYDVIDVISGYDVDVNYDEDTRYSNYMSYGEHYEPECSGSHMELYASATKSNLKERCEQFARALLLCKRFKENV